MTQAPAGVGIKIAQIYLESAVFAHRDDAITLPHTTSPDVGEVDINLQVGTSPESTEGFLRCQVGTRPANKPIYSFHVSMVALFQVSGEPGGMELTPFLQRSGVLTLFPFVREAVANLTIRGRFGPVWLHPIRADAFTFGTAAEPAEPAQPRPAKKAVVSTLARKAVGPRAGSKKR